ncbi:MAG: YdiU family protein [Burkholderiaceae bacterium]|nr:YdiU family protein [Rhodoferax sp.]MCP5285951.1 YdiU family protein [Burkholderiaceae bacterium]
MSDPAAPPADLPTFAFDNSFVRSLPQAGVPWPPVPVAAPALVYLNRALAGQLGLDADALATPAGAAVFAGNRIPDGAQPVAQAYAGHQFGGFSSQLGDGRALLLGEIIGPDGRRRDLALKGSGRTPFSRGGDGRAALGPMLREVLIGEAMHALGIPTTRALAVAATGESVRRDRDLPGAVLARVAASHLRVGSFQYFAARGDRANLAQMVDYAIARHDPDLVHREDRHVQFLERVARRQAALVAQWMNAGFIHGVMNTDNMTLSGETIDYGPCAFLEAYDPAAVFSSIDHGGRYAYANQPLIARWNLARLAETLLPLLADADDDSSVQQAVAQVTAVIDAFPAWYDDALRTGQRRKLGLRLGEAGDAVMADDFLALLQRQGVDFTLGWRRLADAAVGDDAPWLSRFADAGAAAAWLARWRARCLREDGAAGLSDLEAATRRAQAIRRASPFVIPRNHRVEEALAAATDEGDLAPFERLLQALQQPFEELPTLQRFGEPAPAAVTAGYQTFCGT